MRAENVYRDVEVLEEEKEWVISRSSFSSLAHASIASSKNKNPAVSQRDLPDVPSGLLS